EYGGKAPAKGEPWPHMLLNQRLLVHPALTELRAVPFRIRYRLVRAVARQGPGWDPRRHTAQFVFYVTLQNLTRGSEGYGDYLYFGALLYDLRFPMPPPFAALDRGTAKKQGTGKFIFQPAFARLSDRSPHDGQPVEIDIDLLPMLEEAIEEAWRRGYLAGSRQRGDYRLSGMNMGWETTGPVDAELEIEHLFLEARTIPPPG
ncbi:MAG: hypothetical protein JXR77_16885, partial [Lentisphaeria bacterium]|nr:hypothetical protein [Lentisphaeria bacterium]